MSKTELHKDRSRMGRDIELIELDPYAGEMEDTGIFRWKSEWEVQEWVYNKAYDCGVEPLWKIAPSEIPEKIGRLYLEEGPDDATHFLDGEVEKCINIGFDDYLSSYIDGQMRLFAGYDVAENGDTLEEGDYSTWENLRIFWEAGFEDRLRDNERYESL